MGTRPHPAGGTWPSVVSRNKAIASAQERAAILEEFLLPVLLFAISTLVEKLLELPVRDLVFVDPVVLQRNRRQKLETAVNP